MTEQRAVPSLALALQGGGTHGAFSWGVLDRLLEEIEAGRLRVNALSGASAGAINAALFAGGLTSGGPAAARKALCNFWEDLSRRGYLAGNPLFGFADPGVFGFNIDWSPGAIFLEAVGLVVSPYTNPFYTDALAPLLDRAFPDDLLARLNAPDAPRVFVSATNVGTNERAIFSQPTLTRDALRASAALPDEFKAVEIGGSLFWDGGYLGNPALSPLVDVARDVLLVLVNPFNYDPKPPYTARQILDRLNQVTFNASVVLEVNAIEAVNRVVAAAGGDVTKPGGGRYEQVRLHLIRNDRFLEKLGFVSKSSTSWPLLRTLFEHGRGAATAWLAAHADKIGREPSVDTRAELLKPLLSGGD
jgi:NTE family protein